MSSGVKKTNAMRMLDSAKIPYEVRTYEFEETDLAGVHAADAVGMPYETVFKTLVARGDKTGFVVFCIPVAEELDLKKAARASKNKSVELLHVKDLLPTTGYIRGGCSPVGMKKEFPTYIDETVMIKPSKNESVITTPSFFVFVMAVPMRSPMGVMAVSAPVVKNIMPTKMSTAPIKKHSRTLGESGAMVNESASTMVMMGRTA